MMYGNGLPYDAEGLKILINENTKSIQAKQGQENKRKIKAHQISAFYTENGQVRTESKYLMV